MLTEEDLLLARIEATLNRVLSSAASKRKVLLRAMDASERRLRVVLRRKVEAGFTSPRMEQETLSALAALRYLASGFASWAQQPTAERKQPRPEHTAALASPRARRDARLLRRGRLSGELNLLEQTIGSPMEDGAREGRAWLEIRRLQVRAQLGVTPLAEAARGAHAILARSRVDMEPKRLGDIESLVALFAWYGSTVMGNVYGTSRGILGLQGLASSPVSPRSFDPRVSPGACLR